jgi:membrane peptidoglycan carboxypeptidase
MSEHRRKPPQSPDGGRAAARRAARQQPPPSGGRRATPRSQSESYDHASGATEPEEPYMGRAAARRAAQQGGSRRRKGGPGPGPGRGRAAAAGPPPKRRFIDYPRWGKDGWRRWMPSWKQVTGLCIAFVGALVGVSGVAYAMVEVPQENLAAKAQNNVYYWDDGKQMAATGGEVNRQNVKIAQIPQAMQNAVISGENKTFRTDAGVDPMGIARALFNMAKGGDTQGGSTITQQYVKNTYLSQDQTISRKFKELFISIKVGTQMSKDKIMQGYLNTSYFGRGAFGIQAAARTYYNKDAIDLNPSQCAFLASLLKGATYYDPAGNPDIDPTNATPAKNLARAKGRWTDILNLEVTNHQMSQADRAKITTFPMPVPVKKNANQVSGQTGYLIDLAKGYFLANNKQGITAEDLARGGYQIHTTFNKKKVQALEKAVKKVYAENIDPKKRPNTDKYVQFGGASVSPKDGAIAAIYGGTDATKHFTNNADDTGAQVGSTFKPFVLAAAMQYGKRDPSGSEDQPDYGKAGSERTIVSPNSVYDGKNKLKILKYNGDVWTDKDGKEWLQTNDGDESYGNITLRKAMQFSVNSPYVQLGMDVGTDKVKQAAIAAGLRENSLVGTSQPSFSIGVSHPSAIRMAGAYSTFAASGKQNDPYSVTEVTHDGNTVYKHKTETQQAFDADVADNVTDVLKNVVDNGTGTKAKLTGRQVAGKTGTTDGNKSAWFVGYTPQLSTAIDMYRLDDNEKSKNRTFLQMYGTGGQEKIHGASFPAEIWHDYMQEALNGTTPEDFPTPGKLGKVVYGGGASSPKPSQSATASNSPSSSPSNSPSESPTGSGDPSESATGNCNPFLGCNDSSAGGTDSGASGSSSPSTSQSGQADGGANSNGGQGLIAGNDGQ